MPRNNFNLRQPVPEILQVTLTEITAIEKSVSVLLEEKFRRFISREISSGRYSTASEVISAALLSLERERSQTKAVRQALIKGERSGWVEQFDAEKHLQAIHKRKK